MENRIIQYNGSLDKLQDPKFYLENLCKIKTKSDGLQPFILNEAQKDLFNTIRKHDRVICLKCRQAGFSTAVTGFAYHFAITNPGKTIALIGYNSDLTKELLDKVKTFWRTTPEALRPTLQYNSKFEISFPKLESKILVLPSTEYVGRGYTLHFVLATEVAFWDNAEEKMAVLEASVPIKGKIIIESTPSEIGSFFYRMWKGENGYTKREYGWWWAYSEEEIAVIEQRMNDPQKFAREYALEFGATGRSVFDTQMVKKARKNILRVGEKNSDGEIVVEEDLLRIYRRPDPSKTYVIGADPSEGVKGGDPSAAVIFDRVTGEEVAMFNGFVAPDRFASYLDRWGRMYNSALCVCEVNNHGLTTITALKNLIYPSIYYRPAKFETSGTSWSDKLGWRTTKVTRPLMIDDLTQAVRDEILTFHSEEILDQMFTFVFSDSGDMVASQGAHDDALFAAALSYQGFKVLSPIQPTQLDYRHFLPQSYAY